MKIINLTQHQATFEQIAEGVVEPNEKELIKQLLTFDEMPNLDLIRERAKALGELAAIEAASHNGDINVSGTKVMIGGAPWFGRFLEDILRTYGMIPVYSFTKRVSVDIPQPDGTVQKRSVFKHEGFLETT